MASSADSTAMITTIFHKLWSPPQTGTFVLSCFFHDAFSLRTHPAAGVPSTLSGGKLSISGGITC